MDILHVTADELRFGKIVSCQLSEAFTDIIYVDISPVHFTVAVLYSVSLFPITSSQVKVYLAQVSVGGGRGGN